MMPRTITKKLMMHHDAEEHEAHGHDHELDPHVWLDPVLAIKEVETIRDQLSKKYPDDKADFEKMLRTISKN